MERGEFITCKAPYGYRIKDGKDLEIHEKEAAIIQLIFASYLSGESTVEIAANLTAMGLRTRDGNENWTPLSVSYILQNEKYIGDALCQKTLATDSFPSGEAVHLTNAVNRALEHPNKPEDIVSLILQGISARYDCCSVPTEADCRPSEVDFKRFGQEVSHITILNENDIKVHFK